MDLLEELRMIAEGINDPYIFKAVFLAGGPGSGKSFIANHMFAGAGLKFLNTDLAFEVLLGGRGLSFDIDPKKPLMYKKQMVARDYAKKITKKREGYWLGGMLGIVVDGTGKDYDEISKARKRLEGFGYDTAMVFVNTSLDVAHERNEKRKRSVPKDVVIKSWNQVQNNMGKFQTLFGGSNFIIVDNNKKLSKKEITQLGSKLRARAVKWASKPVKNKIGKNIIDTLKRTGGKTMIDFLATKPKNK
jgi:predicted kinase